MNKIEVYSKKHGTKVILFDDEDYPLVCKFKWHILKQGNCFYAVAHSYNDQGDRILIYLHRLVFKADGVIDHKDRDGLNNQKSNLRMATPSQNSQNTKSLNKTGFKGIKEHRKKFMARIFVNGARLYLGTYKTAKQAAIAYNKAAIKYFGEYAYINPIELNPTNMK